MSSKERANEPFIPLYKVKVSDAIKDGEVIQYTVKTYKVEDDGDEFCTVREYEDFEWLHHCLVTQEAAAGIIIPPLPPKPVVEARAAENKSRKQLGSTSKTLVGDEFHKDCKQLETYLKLMLGHRTLGRNEVLVKFLTEKAAPARAKVRQGIFGRISSVLGDAKKSTHRDVDEYFQKERDWANTYSTLIKDDASDFNNIVHAEQRLAGAYAHLTTALNLGGGFSDKVNADANRLLVKLGEALDDTKHGLDVDSVNSENTLSFHLDLYARYLESLKEMHQRRTSLLLAYEDSNRELEKAKPHKKQEAEEKKKAAEKAFEECSDSARDEMRVLHRQRVLAFQDALSQYADANIKTARDTYALLAKNLLIFKQMTL